MAQVFVRHASSRHEGFNLQEWFQGQNIKMTSRKSKVLAMEYPSGAPPRPHQQWSEREGLGWEARAIKMNESLLMSGGYPQNIPIFNRKSIAKC